MKIIRPRGQLQLQLLCLLPQPQPQSVACCHISHATLCPLMSMPDICHGPCTTYIIHPHLRHGRRHALLLFLYRGKDLWTNILENREKERKEKNTAQFGGCLCPSCDDPWHMLLRQLLLLLYESVFIAEFHKRH